MEELHVGTCKTVVSMQIGDNTELQEFLNSMIKSNPAAMRRLQTAMATISSEENYVNRHKYKSTSETGIYEIKTGNIRLYCFQDRLTDDNPCLIITTNGGTKNTKKEQSRDIQKAAQIRAQYHAAKESNKTVLTYNEQSDEN